MFGFIPEALQLKIFPPRGSDKGQSSVDGHESRVLTCWNHFPQLLLSSGLPPVLLKKNKFPPLKITLQYLCPLSVNPDIFPEARQQKLKYCSLNKVVKCHKEESTSQKVAGWSRYMLGDGEEEGGPCVVTWESVLKEFQCLQMADQGAG